MEISDVKQTLYTTLLLLGFDPVSLEKKHRTVTFSKDMFVLPNKKAVEEVLYFLLNKLDPNGCKTQFRDCWPVLDKQQEQQFRRVATSWLNNIAKNDPASHLPRLVPFFNSTGGDRVYMYFLSLSRLVFHHLLTSEFNKKCYQDFIACPSNTANVRICTRMLAILISKAKSQYTSKTKQMLDMQEKWESVVEKYVKSYREDMQAVKELKSKLSEKFNITDFPSPTTATSPATLQISLPVGDSKASELADKFSELLGKFKSKKEIFDSISDGSVGKYVVDGNAINVVVPSQILKDHEDDIIKKKITSLHTDGKLDILNVIKLWNIMLKQYRDSLRKGSVGLQEMSAFNLKTAQILNRMKSNFEQLSTLNKTMSEDFLPGLRVSVDKHYLMAKDKFLSSKIQEPMKIASLNRSGLTPLKFPQPVVMGTPARKDVSQAEAFDEDSRRVESTPESMARIMKKVDEEIQRKAYEEAKRIDDRNNISMEFESEICRNVSDSTPAVDEFYIKPSFVKLPRGLAAENSTFNQPPQTKSIKKPLVRKSVAPQSNIRLPSVNNKINVRDTPRKSSKVGSGACVVKSSSLQNLAVPSSTSKPQDLAEEDHLDELAEQVVDEFLQTPLRSIGTSNAIKSFVAENSFIQGGISPPNAQTPVDGSATDFLQNIINNKTLKKYRNYVQNANVKSEITTNISEDVTEDVEYKKTPADYFEENFSHPNFVQSSSSCVPDDPRSGTSYDILKASKDRFHLKTVEGLQLRRMTANLFELAQSQTPEIRVKTKSMGADAKERGVKIFKSSEENHSRADEFNRDAQSELSILGEDAEIDSFDATLCKKSNSKLPTRPPEVPFLALNFDSKEGLGAYKDLQQKENDSLFNLKLPSVFEGIETEEFEGFLPPEESPDSSPPSVDRRLSRRFHFRPDVVDGKTLFDGVDECIFESEPPDASLRDDSLIDLDGFDDTNLLS